MAVSSTDWLGLFTILVSYDRSIGYAFEWRVVVDMPRAVVPNSKEADTRPTGVDGTPGLDPNAIGANRINCANCSANVRARSSESLYLLNIVP